LPALSVAAIVVEIALGAALAVLTAIWWFWRRRPQRQLDKLQIDDPKECSDTDENFRKTMGQAIAAAVALIGAGAGLFQFLQQKQANSKESLKQPVAPPPPTDPAFPIKVSASRRYFVDQNNTPWLLQGANAQMIMQMASVTDATTWLRARAAQGFNCNWCNLITGQNFTDSNLGTYDGIQPFTSNSLTAPNEAYFARMDEMFAAAAASKIVMAPVVIDDYAYTSTWIGSEPQAHFASFGTFVGNRYKNTPNIIWYFGNDYGHPSGIGFTGPKGWNARDPKYIAMHAAILAADPNHLTSGENSPPCITMDDTNWNGHGIVNFNSAYCYVPTYEPVLRGYSYSPTMPVVMVEGAYEGPGAWGLSGPQPSTCTPYQIRIQVYWAMCSGAAGQFWGTRADVTSSPGWLNTNSPSAIQMSYFAAFSRSVAWCNLVPDVSIPCTPGQARGIGGAYPGSTTITGRTFVTGGYGTLQVPSAPFTPPIDNAPVNFVAAALTPDGTLGVVYCPSRATITVAMSRMASSTTARWFDPSSGKYSSISGSPFANTGTRNFTTPGNNSEGSPDWVLLLQAAASPPPR
jgi:hypothetical protein